MKPLKHMEAIFGGLAAAALLTAALADGDARAAARAHAPAPSAASAGANANANANNANHVADHATMPVVIIKGKRPNAREKRRLALAANA